MKRVLLLAVLVMVMAGGCERLLEYRNDAGNILTPAQYQLLSAADQAEYAEQQVTRVDPVILGRVTTGLNVAKEVQGQWGGLLGPYGELAGAVISLALIALGIVRKAKVVKALTKTETLLTNVKAGARITAESIEKILEPASEHWKDFTLLQTSKRNKMRLNPDAPDPIMPDEV